MGSMGLGKMFEGYLADTCVDKFLLGSMGEQATPSSLRRQGARTGHATIMQKLHKLLYN